MAENILELALTFAKSWTPTELSLFHRLWEGEVCLLLHGEELRLGYSVAACFGAQDAGCEGVCHHSDPGLPHARGCLSLPSVTLA